MDVNAAASDFRWARQKSCTLAKCSPIGVILQLAIDLTSLSVQASMSRQACVEISTGFEQSSRVS
jgi:hypothetical protein